MQNCFRCAPADNTTGPQGPAAQQTGPTTNDQTTITVEPSGQGRTTLVPQVQGQGSQAAATSSPSTSQVTRADIPGSSPVLDTRRKCFLDEKQNDGQAFKRMGTHGDVYKFYCSVDAEVIACKVAKDASDDAYIKTRQQYQEVFLFFGAVLCKS